MIRSLAFALALWFVLIAHAQDATENHLEMMAASSTTTALESCNLGSWAVVGICTWLLCIPQGCYPMPPSPLITMYTYGGFVAVYHEYNNSPIFEDQVLYHPLLDPIAYLAMQLCTEAPITQLDAGNSQIQGGRGMLTLKSTSTYSEATVYAHPGATALKNLDTGLFPPLPVGPPLTVHYSSQMDACNWRSGYLDRFWPETWAPWSQIGKWPAYSWGSRYPRAGFQSHLPAQDPRNQAVLAARAWDIVQNTGRWTPRAAWTIELTDAIHHGWHYFHTGKHRHDQRWLMLFPNREEGFSNDENLRCHRFGDTLDFPWQDVLDSDVPPEEKDGDYIYGVYQKVTACKANGNKLMEKFEWDM